MSSIVQAVKQVTLHGSGLSSHWVAYLPIHRTKQAIADRDQEEETATRCRAISDGLPAGVTKRTLLAYSAGMIYS